MTAAGLIFANIHDQSIPELTRVRSMASVPFGCRYRLIDFTLSNMVNSGITKVGLITHYNYQSLLDHIGTGKDWDLARRSGGIKILPPTSPHMTMPQASLFMLLVWRLSWVPVILSTVAPRIVSCCQIVISSATSIWMTSSKHTPRAVLT